MQTLLEQIQNIAIVFGLAFFMVIVAMGIDLALGLRKAKQRGEYRSSTGLRKTVTKLLIYGGAMVLTFFVDVLLNWSGMLHIFHMNNAVGMPVITCLAALFIIAIELKSIFEKADKKTRNDAANAAAALADILKNKDAAAALEEVLKRVRSEESGERS